MPQLLAEGANGYNNKNWKEGDKINYLIKNYEIYKKYPIYTNTSDALYILTGIKGKESEQI